MECDFLVIGSGILGVSIARELQHRHPDARVVVLDKEPELGRHASGRNSGVLHAGFYYDADSLKARFTREGNRQLTAYCLSAGLPLLRCGKLVVPQCDDDQPVLDELFRRGRRNGIELRQVDTAEAREIEPRVRTRDRALFSPTTTSIDPLAVLRSLARDAVQAGVRLHLGARYLGQSASDIHTSAGAMRAAYVVNAAGLQADRVARDFGFARGYGILPFKGLYLHSDEPAGVLRVHVYPVPNLRNPFLGVHCTVTVDGRMQVGPTAMPAFWREQYTGFSGFQLRECVEILRRQLRFARAAPDLGRIAWEELRKRSRRHMVQLASRLVEGVHAADLTRWGRPGIRAQLVELGTGQLVHDFVVEGDDRSLHVLNAVSPAFTCCLPFAAWICDEIEERRA